MKRNEMDLNSYTSMSSLNTRMSESSSDFSFKSSDSNIRLEEHIKLHHLHKLLQQFQSHVPMQIKHGDATDRKGIALEKSKDDGREIVQRPGMMTLAEFKVIISSMLGTKKWNDQMEMLFYKVDTGCDGYVDWNEFCTYMLLQMREVEHIQNTKLVPFTTEAVVKRAYHNKQETSTKMLLVENPTRIVNISKVGDIGVWDTELRLLKTYKLGANFTADELGARRRCHTWVTGAVYMRNAQKFALTTTSREIYFYDTSTATYYAEFCLYALPNVPNCVNYWYSERATNTRSLLVFGDDKGSVHILSFHAPESRLFEKPFSPQQGTQRIYFNDIASHKRFVTYECIPNIHEQEVIRRVMYVADGDVILSSSVSPETSVVLMDMQNKKKTYVYKVKKGVECFDYSKTLNVLVTGSLDHFIRVWNPYVESKPICHLQGHSTGICDVVINRSFAQIISYSKDAVIKVWDLKEHNCIQTITLKIPSIQPGRIPDHGEFPISLFEQPHDLMLVSCNDCIALLKMGKLEPPPEAPTTHKAPLCNAIYNDLFHQVVTAADDSTVTVWNIENGTRSLKFSNAHGQEEITCLAFDKTYRRLLTGARDGTIKAWSFQNGNCLHEFESIAEAEVTGIMSFQDRKILAVGWSRRITLYDDSDPDMVFVSATTCWKGGQIHKDDITTMDHCDPNLLATGSYDGTIIVWNGETQQIMVTLRDSSNKPEGSFAPIEKLLFLRERVSKRLKNSAVLLSSESGVIYLWSIFGHNNLLGKFSAVEKPDASVLGMSTSPDNSVLITTDTDGYVTVWDISDYCHSDVHELEDSRPTMKQRWKGHDKAIVNVDYVDYELQGLLVTSSTDRTARLWTIDGKFVGTFGQQKKWNLKRPATFQSSRNAAGKGSENVTFKESFEENDRSSEKRLSEQLPSKIVNDQDEHNNNTTGDEPLSAVNDAEPKKTSPKSESFKKEPDTNGKLPDINSSPTPKDSTRLNQRRMTTHPNAGGNPRNIPKHKLRWKESRSTTIAQFQISKEKILGEKAENHLARRTATRQERRYRVGYINRNTTSRFGNLCSPFQALSIPGTEKIYFSSELPMSQRMHDKGMACLSEKDLGKLPLSHLLEMGDNDTDSVMGDRHHRSPSSRRQYRQGSTRRNTLFPAIHSRASSVASVNDRSYGGTRSTASSACGSR